MIETFVIFQILYIIAFLVVVTSGYFLLPKLIKSLFKDDESDDENKDYFGSD
jgi:uncharacterized protein YneF (UPF0154 family)